MVTREYVYSAEKQHYMMSGERVPALSVGPYLATRTGLCVTGETDAESFRAYLCATLLVAERVLWIVGDAILWGERHYPEVVDEIIQSGRYQRHTLSNARWVASRVEQERRRPAMAWTMHEAVAGLEPREQDVLLDAAEAEEWSREELREAVREAKGEMVDAFIEELHDARRAVRRLLGVADTNARIDGTKLALAALEDLM